MLTLLFDILSPGVASAVTPLHVMRVVPIPEIMSSTHN